MMESIFKFKLKRRPWVSYENKIVQCIIVGRSFNEILDPEASSGSCVSVKYLVESNLFPEQWVREDQLGESATEIAEIISVPFNEQKQR